MAQVPWRVCFIAWVCVRAAWSTNDVKKMTSGVRWQPGNECRVQSKFRYKLPPLWPLNPDWLQLRGRRCMCGECLALCSCTDCCDKDTNLLYRYGLYNYLKGKQADSSDWRWVRDCSFFLSTWWIHTLWCKRRVKLGFAFVYYRFWNWKLSSCSFQCYCYDCHDSATCARVV